MGSIKGNKETEYRESLASYRFFHEYRIKIFGFFITFNGALISVVSVYAKSFEGQIAISIFAILASIMSLISEMTVTYAARHFAQSAKSLEDELGFIMMTKLRESIGVPLSKPFRALYIMIILMWVGYIVYNITAS